MVGWGHIWWVGDRGWVGEAYLGTHMVDWAQVVGWGHLSGDISGWEQPLGTRDGSGRCIWGQVVGWGHLLGTRMVVWGRVMGWGHPLGTQVVMGGDTSDGGGLMGGQPFGDTEDGLGTPPRD